MKQRSIKGTLMRADICTRKRLHVEDGLRINFQHQRRASDAVMKRLIRRTHLEADRCDTVPE